MCKNNSEPKKRQYKGKENPRRCTYASVCKKTRKRQKVLKPQQIRCNTYQRVKKEQKAPGKENEHRTGVASRSAYSENEAKKKKKKKNDR